MKCLLSITLYGLFIILSPHQWHRPAQGDDRAGQDATNKKINEQAANVNTLAQIQANPLEEVIGKVRAGKTLTAGEKNTAQEEFEKTEDNCIQAMLDFYITSVKLSIIDPERHSGWPARNWILFLDRILVEKMLRNIDTRLRKTPEPIVYYSRICLALAAGQENLVNDSLSYLKAKDEFLYHRAQENLGWWREWVPPIRKQK
jgi:hypothetical protein